MRSSSAAPHTPRAPATRFAPHARGQSEQCSSKEIVASEKEAVERAASSIHDVLSRTPIDRLSAAFDFTCDAIGHRKVLSAVLSPKYDCDHTGAHMGSNNGTDMQIKEHGIFLFLRDKLMHALKVFRTIGIARHNSTRRAVLRNFIEIELSERRMPLFCGRGPRPFQGELAFQNRW